MEKNVGVYKSPMYESMKAEKNKIRIRLKNADNGLKQTGKTITNFQVAGADRKFLEAKAEIKGNNIVVYHTSVKNPVAVRFCFDDTAMPNVFNKEGLPLAPFRTDNWI
jgi:sialate O-acetylesterase